MKSFLKHNAGILAAYSLAFVTALYFLTNYEKNNIHLYMNGYVGDKLLNFFFYYITYLGDGRFAAIMLLLVLVYNVRLGICTTAAFLSATLVSTVLKFVFFDDSNRPFYEFSYIERHTLKLVEGVDVHIHNSFPSGHATQAFAILMCVAFAAERQAMKFLFMALALFTSLSRVYLSQHWLVDITAGSALGMGFSMLLYLTMVQNNKMPRLNKPIFELRKT